VAEAVAEVERIIWQRLNKAIPTTGPQHERQP
jgi:hypothetical protein